MRVSFIAGCIIAALAPAMGFLARKSVSRGIIAPSMSAVAEQSIVSIDAPDFYWKFRLDRLASKKAADLPFKATNYPDVSGGKDLYDAYYLDLTLQGKMEGFDWKGEKEITDAEWMGIYKSICGWSADTVKQNKPGTSNLPSDDFDLLKQFYPQLSFRDLEVPFISDEVGANFPYKSMKEMLTAAVAGNLNIPGAPKTIASLEATEIRAELAALKEKTMSKLDSILADSVAYAQNPFPDEESRAHYKTLKSKLSNFPQTPQAWADFRSNMEKEVDEMARLASKPEEHGHHHEEDANHISPAQEFEQKYGKNLDQMQERMAKYKSDPKGFLEASILEKFGKSGLDVWKKSQEFSDKISVISEADRQATEAAFTSFLQKA